MGVRDAHLITVAQLVAFLYGLKAGLFVTIDVPLLLGQLDQRLCRTVQRQQQQQQQQHVRGCGNSTVRVVWGAGVSVLGLCKIRNQKEVITGNNTV